MPIRRHISIISQNQKNNQNWTHIFKLLIILFSGDHIKFKYNKRNAVLEIGKIGCKSCRSMSVFEIIEISTCNIVFKIWIVYCITLLGTESHYNKVYINSFRPVTVLFSNLTLFNSVSWWLYDFLSISRNKTLFTMEFVLLHYPFIQNHLNDELRMNTTVICG